MKFLSALVLTFGVTLLACTDDQDLKGNLVLSITDSPSDNDLVKGVNLYVTNVEAKTSGDWKSLLSSEQPIGFNLLSFTGSESFVLIDQFINPGTLSQLRFTLNLADFNSGLIKNPQCNVLFTDGTTKPIYFADSSSSQVIINQTLGVQTRAKADYTFDFDVRKSLVLDDQGNFIFKPSIRVIETAKAGHVSATVSNVDLTDHTIVFSYPAGTFSTTETAVPPAGDVMFSHAVNSSKIVAGKFALGFLPAGSYDLVFAKHNAAGGFINILGLHHDVTVTAGETLTLAIDMSNLAGS